jgi:hypothetical protein
MTDDERAAGDSSGGDGRSALPDGIAAEHAELPWRVSC